MGKLSRNKGAAWEREVAGLFGGYRTAPMQAGHADEFPDVVAPRFAIECKCGARGSWNDENALLQAECARRVTGADGNAPYCTRTPIAVCKEDRHRPYVVIYLCDLVDLFGAHDSPAEKSCLVVRVDLIDFMEELNVPEGS